MSPVRSTRSLRSLFSALLLAGLGAAASCGGSGDPAAAGQTDVRCTALCDPAGVVPASGTGTYCSEASVTQCKSLCGVQIQSASTLCASCLLEKADFGTGAQSDSSGSNSCDMSTCTLTNSVTGEKCTYPVGDGAARKDCQKKLYPATAKACAAPDFRPVTECASVCGQSPA